MYEQPTFPYYPKPLPRSTAQKRVVHRKICYNTGMKNKPIAFRQSLFWDVDPKTIDPDKNAVYVIERILDFGDDSEVRWMWKYYDHALIRKVVHTSRVLQPPSRALWTLVFA